MSLRVIQSPPWVEERFHAWMLEQTVRNHLALGKKTGSGFFAYPRETARSPKSFIQFTENRSYAVLVSPLFSIGLLGLLPQKAVSKPVYIHNTMSNNRLWEFRFPKPLGNCSILPQYRQNYPLNRFGQRPPISTFY